MFCRLIFLIITVIAIPISVYSKEVYVCIWEKAVHYEFINFYKIDINKIDINNFDVNKISKYLVLVSESIEEVERNKKVLERKAFFSQETVDGYYWNNIFGSKDIDYTELPDGRWFGFVCVGDRKRNYCEWEKIVVSGKIEGSVKVYDKRRKINIFSEYANGKRNGFAIYYKNGVVSAFYYFKNGLFVEEVAFKNENDVTRTTINGEKKIWNDKGKLIGAIKIDSTLSWSNYIEYYENGLIEVIGNYIKRAKDSLCVKDSIWRYYNLGGDLIREETWRNGEQIK